MDHYGTWRKRDREPPGKTLSGRIPTQEKPRQCTQSTDEQTRKGDPLRIHGFGGKGRGKKEKQNEEMHK